MHYPSISCSASSISSNVILEPLIPFHKYESSRFSETGNKTTFFKQNILIPV